MISNKQDDIELNQINNLELDGQEIRYQAGTFWTKALIWSIAGSVGFGFVFACIARIDEVVIARGELQALGAERPIKAPVVGVISKIFVREGGKVEAGEKLIEFDKNVLVAREDSLKAKLEELQSTLIIEGKILEEITVLRDAGGIQMIQFLQQKNRVRALEFEIKQLKANIREVQFDAEKTRLISPVKGTVFDLIPQSPGYASTLGETLLKIVPDGVVEAKVFLSNSDIGFVTPNMKAQVRVDAYPFTRFGSILGELKSVGQEVLPSDFQNPEPRFPAYVKLSQQYLIKDKKHYPVRSGQSVSVNLIVRDKPVISLLTDALDKAFDSLRGIKS